MKKTTTLSPGEKRLLQLWTDHCRHIAENGFTTVPTRTGFSHWLACRQEACAGQGEAAADKVTADKAATTAPKAAPLPDPTAPMSAALRREFERVRGDTLATGALLGKYQQTVTALALKNWCGWTDKTDTRNENVNMTTVVAEVERMVCSHDA